MKIIHLLVLFTIGCSIPDESQVEEIEDEQSEDYSGYHDDEFVGESKHIPCPKATRTVTLNGKTWQMEIPSECQREMIDTGRPWQEQEQEQEKPEVDYEQIIVMDT
jgi:hypothetical protein